MSLEPHHVLCVEPPRLLFQRLRCQILRLRPLHVVEDEKERLCWQPLKEFNRIWPLWRQLRVVVGRRTRVPRQVRSQPFRVWWMRHVEVSRFEHLVLQLRFLRERNWSEGCYAEQWRNVRFSLWTSILRLWRVEQAWKKWKTNAVNLFDNVKMKKRLGQYLS